MDQKLASSAVEPATDRPRARTLRFPGGAARLTIESGPASLDLAATTFSGPRPRVTVIDDTVTVDYRHPRPLGWLAHALGRSSACVRPAEGTAWRIEANRGMADVHADLRQLHLDDVHVEGGMSGAVFELPRPCGSVTIRIAGGATRLELRRPPGVEARVRVGRGASHLRLDDQRFRAVGGGLVWHTPGFPDATDRYDIEISGGARHLTVASPTPPTTTGAET